MKQSGGLKALLIGCLVLFATGERAGAITGSANLAVTETVVNSCSVVIGSSLNFGTFDITSPNPQNGVGIVSITCTDGAPAYVTLGQGQNPGSGSSDPSPIRQMAASGTTDHLLYQIYRDAAFTQPWGNTQVTGQPLTGTGVSQSAQVYARVLPGQNVASGTYVDSVLATITY